MRETTRFLADEQATLDAGALLAAELTDELVFLVGDLGAGKTTLVRGLLRALGHPGAVKSPTYTLLEPYDLGGRRIYHFDFYRIRDPSELSYIGVDDLLNETALKLIEWPVNGAGLLPDPDIELILDVEGSGRRLHVLDHRE